MNVYKSDELKLDPEYSEYMEVACYNINIEGMDYKIKPFYRREISVDDSTYDYSGVHTGYEVVSCEKVLGVKIENIVISNVESIESAKQLVHNHFENNWEMSYVRDLSELQEKLY